jgi:hypothetical protein
MSGLIQWLCHWIKPLKAKKMIIKTEESITPCEVYGSAPRRPSWRSPERFALRAPSKKSLTEAKKLKRLVENWFCLQVFRFLSNYPLWVVLSVSHEEKNDGGWTVEEHLLQCNL